MYNETINNYLKKGHARKLTPTEYQRTSSITNYIPHHGVTHPNKPGKVRIVFDATAEYDNKSLNGSLLVGPDLLNNLVAVILRFRQGMFCRY